MSFILDDSDEFFNSMLKNLGKEKKVLSKKEREKTNLEIKEMEANLHNYEWWAEKYPEEFEPLLKQIKEEEAKKTINHL